VYLYYGQVNFGHIHYSIDVKVIPRVCYQNCSQIFTSQDVLKMTMSPNHIKLVLL